MISCFKEYPAGAVQSDISSGTDTPDGNGFVLCK
jgi:hypothetical protein